MIPLLIVTGRRITEAQLSLALPEGKYIAEWISPLTGKVLKTGDEYSDG
jgi:hypothetical protein